MSIDVMRWVWSHRHPEQTPVDRLVLLALADAGNDDGVTWTGIDALMTKADASRSAVYESLKRLAQSGQLRSWKEGKRTFHQVLMASESFQILDVQNLESVQDPESASPESGNPPAPPYKENPKKSNPKKQRRSREVAVRPEVDELCELLADHIEANGNDRPFPHGDPPQGWRDPARLMLDRDGLTIEAVRYLIDWSQNDEFWRANVLSMSKLREKRATLKAQARREYERRQQRPVRRSLNGDTVTPPTELLAWARRGDADDDRALEAGA